MPETVANPPGRNEPCHCGSGKKYKRCCRSRDEEKRHEASAKIAAKASKGSKTDSKDEANPKAPDPRRPADQSWRRSAQTQHSYQRLMAPRKRGDR